MAKNGLHLENFRIINKFKPYNDHTTKYIKYIPLKPMTFIKYWTKILSYELSKKISKCPKWGFTCIKTEISAKLWCCSDYFDQITRVFNHGGCLEANRKKPQQ